MKAAKHEPQPVDCTPETYGSWCWDFLAFSAVRFDRLFFLRLCHQLIVILDCPDCRQHWIGTLIDDPPEECRSAYEACRWVWRVHNAVNLRIKKPIFSYEQMQKKYGAPAK